MKNDYAYLDLLEHPLDDQQKKVCCSVQNAVVAAGAGSGKTQVLATRFAWLVMEFDDIGAGGRHHAGNPEYRHGAHHPFSQAPLFSSDICADDLRCPPGDGICRYPASCVQTPEGVPL